MPTYVLLLRAVNLGGHGRLPMPELKRLLEQLGHADVSTFLQSGNALFGTARTDEEGLRTEIEGALAAELGLEARCLLRDRTELRRVVEGNPLRDVATNPARLLVTFLLRAPDRAAWAAVAPEAVAPVVLAPGAREIYGWYPNGIGQSRLTPAFFEKRLRGEVATGRNWRTVTTLLELMGG